MTLYASTASICGHVVAHVSSASPTTCSTFLLCGPCNFSIYNTRTQAAALYDAVRLHSEDYAADVRAEAAEKFQLATLDVAHFESAMARMAQRFDKKGEEGDKKTTSAGFEEERSSVGNVAQARDGSRSSVEAINTPTPVENPTESLGDSGLLASADEAIDTPTAVEGLVESPDASGSLASEDQTTDTHTAAEDMAESPDNPESPGIGDEAIDAPTGKTVYTGLVAEAAKGFRDDHDTIYRLMAKWDMDRDGGFTSRYVYQRLHRTSYTDPYNHRKARLRRAGAGNPVYRSWARIVQNASSPPSSP